ncbi:hypothetical protein KOI35_03985 [Actinoplanes bogorensis]|uniref:Uncharacterized protein n=1 Tax=Paractinoplanes bogorensis TaxID=1610840 RepID=A0ABS5YIT7_9ACTN|nr:hypothetical protein [Actinoplanes bogorensis]MBU2662658.1 hypothetical protein [Actinoplanes bogorensis]
MLWREVFVPDHVVGSDDFRAEVGGVVEMALALQCHDRAVLDAPGDGQRHGDDLVGRVVAVESSWPDGWMLDVNGLGIYVSEAAQPLPPSGAWVRVRGELSIAEYYETDLYEPTDELRQRAERRWHVRRIVRLELGTGRREDVTAIRFDPVRRLIGYRLDLEQVRDGQGLRSM